MAVQRDKVIASAEKLVAKGKIEPAIKEYERLLEDNPNDVNTLNRIGDLWVRINRNDEAVKVFSKIADHYSRDGFFLKAIAIFKKINKLDPSKLDIYAKLADLYAKQGLAMEAKSQYQVLADYYLKHGEPANALQIYRKISELDPQSINVHVKLADLYSQNNQTAEALKEYDRVGRMLLKRGMLDEAQQVFRKALKIDARNTDLVDSLVTALVEAKDYENARQIVETALESNRDNPKLLAMMGKIQLGRGDAAGARATLERAIAADPNETSVREALAELYLKQNDADKALEMVAPLAEKALAKGERGTAIEMLNRIIRVESGHAPTLERLVAVYTRLNEETNILAAMNSLAEAHIARMRFDEASKVLERLIQKEPQNSQHRTKLQFVRSQMGGIDTLPPRPAAKPAPAPVELEIEEPAPSFDISDDSSSFALDLDASEPLELDLSGISTPSPAKPAPAPPKPTSAPAPRPIAPPPPPQHLVPAVELAAADISDAGDDLDFITEHLTEAEVFAKYGLAEKAAEHLRAVLDRAPKNLTAHERLFRILLEEGDNDAARAAAQAYVAVLEEQGDHNAVDTVKNEFTARGQSFESRPITAPIAAMQSAPAATGAISLDDITADSGSEISFDLDAGGAEIEFDIEPPAAPKPAPVPAPAIPEMDLELPAEETIDFSDASLLDDVGPGLDFDEPALEQPVLDEPLIEELPVAEELTTLGEAEPAADLFTPEPELELVESLEESLVEPLDEPLIESLDEPLIESLTEPLDEPLIDFDEPGLQLPEELVEPTPAAAAPVFEQPAAEPAEPFFGVESLGDLEEELPLEELGEIDFYIEQELFDEARRKVEALSARFPGNDNLATRRSRLEAAIAAAAAAVPRPPVLSRDEIENELLSAIPDDDDDFPAPPPSPAPAPPPAAAVPPPSPSPTVSAAVVQEENLFADEDNFFDLAAELESELADEEEPISLSEEEQSLEEIFKEFKKGVEQQLDSEDYDTHYNLGIAYKEMGLIDEAIGEFQLASKDPKRAVECASMLGLCFLEKGMPQLAIKWYRKGLEIPEITEEEHVGLLYDLASAYQEVGDTEQAQKAFMEVYGMNSNYRDIVTRIKALEDARR